MVSLHDDGEVLAIDAQNTAGLLLPVLEIGWILLAELGF